MWKNILGDIHLLDVPKSSPKILSEKRSQCRQENDLCGIMLAPGWSSSHHLCVTRKLYVIHTDYDASANETSSFSVIMCQSSLLGKMMHDTGSMKMKMNTDSVPCLSSGSCGIGCLLRPKFLLELLIMHNSRRPLFSCIFHPKLKVLLKHH